MPGLALERGAQGLRGVEKAALPMEERRQIEVGRQIRGVGEDQGGVGLSRLGNLAEREMGVGREVARVRPVDAEAKGGAEIREGLAQAPGVEARGAAGHEGGALATVLAPHRASSARRLRSASTRFEKAR